MASTEVSLGLQFQAKLDKFLVNLKRRKFQNSSVAAVEALELLKDAVQAAKISGPADLVESIRKVGRVLETSRPLEIPIGNVVRRVLKNIRSEADSSADDADGNNCKGRVIHFISDLIEEIVTRSGNIADQALEHIHTNETILTFGRSSTVEKFLKLASKKREFEVIVAESAPVCDGARMARELAASGISATLISDSAIFAVMARVNKVIVGTCAVMANGGLHCPAGLHAVALAAKHYQVPFVVCTGTHKLCPLYADKDFFNDLNSPHVILSYDEAEKFQDVSVQNPSYDYVSPDLVSLFITNLGAHDPSYIYRLLNSFYQSEDYSLGA